MKDISSDCYVEHVHKTGRFVFLLIRAPKTSQIGDEISLKKVPGIPTIRRIHLAVQTPIESERESISWNPNECTITLGAPSQGQRTILVVGAV